MDATCLTKSHLWRRTMTGEMAVMTPADGDLRIIWDNYWPVYTTMLSHAEGEELLPELRRIFSYVRMPTYGARGPSHVPGERHDRGITTVTTWKSPPSSRSSCSR